MRTSFEGVSIFSSRFRRVLFTRTITTNATTSSLDEAFPVPQRIRLGKRGEDSTDIRRQNKRKEPYYSNSGNVEENTTFESKTNQGKSNFHFNSDQYTERSPFNTRKDDRTRFERLFHKSTSRPPFNSGPIIIEPPSDMPAFYTGRPEYYQALAFLDSLLAAASLSQSPLTIAQIDEWAQQQYSVVSNKHKRTMKNAVVMGQDNYWQDQIKMSYTMGFPLSLQEYYFVLSRLNALKAIVTANSSTISGTSGLISLPVFLEGFVKKGIDETVGNTTGDPLLKKALTFDHLKAGILIKSIDTNETRQSLNFKLDNSYAVAMGYRKTAVAQVWLIPWMSSSKDAFFEREWKGKHGRVFVANPSTNTLQAKLTALGHCARIDNNTPKAGLTFDASLSHGATQSNLLLDANLNTSTSSSDSTSISDSNLSSAGIPISASSTRIPNSASTATISDLMFEFSVKNDARLFNVGRPFNTLESQRLSLLSSQNGASSFRPVQEYFIGPTYNNLKTIFEPMEVTDSYGLFDIFVIVQGGGPSGQAEAIKLGISRALAAYNPEYKNTLSNIGFLERDCRKRERKKPGRKRARKMFTWVRR